MEKKIYPDWMVRVCNLLDTRVNGEAQIQLKATTRLRLFLFGDELSRLDPVVLKCVLFRRMRRDVEVF